MKQIITWLISCALCLVNANMLPPAPTAKANLAERVDDDVKAIIPTSSGQIGVNPVLADLGDPTTYIGEIFGSDSQYITLVTTTHWIGVNSEQITESVELSTTQWIGDNTQYLTITTLNPTSTSTIQVLVATATAATNGQSVGDISVILPEGLAVALSNSAKSAVSACKLPGLKARDENLWKRDEYSDFVGCLANAGVDAAKTGGLFDGFVDSAVWNDVAVTIAPSLETLIHSAIAGLSKLERTKFTVWMAGAIGIGGLMYEAANLGDPGSVGSIAKPNIPAAGLGAPVTKQCPSSAVRNVDSPLCIDLDCLSTDDLTCAVEPNVGCPCILVAETKAQWGNETFLPIQQTVIDDYINGVDLNYIDCVVTTTVYSSQSTSILGSVTFLDPPLLGTYRFCQCDTSIAAIQLATSGTVTTTYCAGGEYAPSGYSHIPAVNGEPLSTAAPVPAQTTNFEPGDGEPPAPTSTANFEPGDGQPPAPTTTSTTTTTSINCNCGAPFCGNGC